MDLWCFTCQLQKGKIKTPISLSDIMAWFFQILSVQQLYRLSTLFWDDNNTQNVSPDVSLFVRISSVMLVILNLVKWICFLASHLSFFQQVLSSMKQLIMEDSNNAVSNSLLLDDDSRWEFLILLHVLSVGL